MNVNRHRQAGRGLLLVALVSFALGAAAGAGAGPRRHADVLVQVKRAADIPAIEAEYNLVDDGVIGLTSFRAFRARNRAALAQLLASLAADDRVIIAQGNDPVSVPEEPNSQFSFAFDAGPDPGKYANQYAYSQIHIGDAWRLTTGRRVRVAVMDTGVNANHPDLSDRCATGYNALDPDENPSDVPDGIVNNAVGHGTMVAGVIARVAPHARIVPIRVLNGDGQGRLQDVLEGICAAILLRCDVVNISFGGATSTPALEETIKLARRAGVVLVASVGNDNNASSHYPALLDGVIGVSAVESDCTKSPFANYGVGTSVVAPGTSIRSTFWDGGYANWTGTSFAAAFVSAEAALIIGANDSIRPNRVARIIERTAASVDWANPAYIGLLGAGLIDVEAAVLRASRGDD